MTRDMHQALENCKITSKSITNFVSNSQSTLEKSVIRAQTMFAFAVAEHNLPFSVTDHFSDIVKKMFPDSEIAAKFACKKTKCTQIVKQALAPDFFKKVGDQCKNQPFSILVDESNDRGTQKCLAVMVRIFEENQSLQDFWTCQL